MRRVFTRPLYLLLAAATALCVLVVVNWPIVPLIGSVFADPSIPFSQSMTIAFALIASIVTDYPGLSLMYALAVALLIGIDTSLLLFYMRMHRAAPSSVSIASGITGLIATTLGFGCAACGTVFLVSLFSTVGGGIAAFFSTYGASLGLIGVVLLALSAATLARAINRPAVCPI